MTKFLVLFVDNFLFFLRKKVWLVKKKNKNPILRGFIWNDRAHRLPQKKKKFDLEKNPQSGVRGTLFWKFMS